MKSNSNDFIPKYLIGNKTQMADGNEQVSVETSDNLFKQFTVDNLTIKTTGNNW